MRWLYAVTAMWLAVTLAAFVFVSLRPAPVVMPAGLAPLPDKVPEPPDNPTTSAKAKLGRLLFFDNRLSGDLTTSCASCHAPSLGWGDGQALSRGYPGTQHWRNSQTVVNSAYLQKLFWAGESTSLESQADAAITGNLAGNADPAMVEERLAQVPEYVAMFKEVFGVDRPSYPMVLKAIAAFERAETNTDNTPFDRYAKGDSGALSESARRGMELFAGKASCVACHGGALFTDESFHNLGVPDSPEFEKDPLRQITLRYQHLSRGVPEEVYRNASTDMGLYYTTKRDEDTGKFRTPPLRYINHTSPYMHNGVLSTLEEVVEFYDRGGDKGPGAKSPLVRPLGLTSSEKRDLVEFLKSLSGPELVIEAPALPKYAPTEAAP